MSNIVLNGCSWGVCIAKWSIGQSFWKYGPDYCIAARNQLGTSGGAKSFLRGLNVSNYVQHIFPGEEKICRGLSPPAPPGYGPATLSQVRNLKFLFLSSLQAVEGIHGVGVYCLSLLAPNGLPRTPLGGVHLSESRSRFLEGELQPRNILMSPHQCVLNLPKPRQKHNDIGE